MMSRNQCKTVPDGNSSIHKEDDLYIATSVEIGTLSQGKTLEEALANLKEATVLWLEEFPVAAGNPVFDNFYN